MFDLITKKACKHKWKTVSTISLERHIELDEENKMQLVCHFYPVAEVDVCKKCGKERTRIVYKI